MPRMWKCTIQSVDDQGKEQETTLEFTDYDEIMIKNSILTGEYFKQIVEKSQKSNKYHLTGGLKKLIDPNGKDYSKHSFYVILGVEKRNILIGMIIGELDPDTFKFVAFYPDFLKEQIKEDPNVIRGLPVLLLEKEEIWQSVNIIAPSAKN